MGGSIARVHCLEHVGLGVRRERYEDAVRFYQELFGWHRLRELPGELTFVGDGAGARLEIFPTDAPALANPYHLAFSVDPGKFDQVRERLAQTGVTLEEPYLNEFGDRIGYFTDPAGNRAQIVARKEPLPE
jgi:catechol 2,3-dioxygenase-like lactoylglutathione lyase family enzyme